MGDWLVGEKWNKANSVQLICIKQVNFIFLKNNSHSNSPLMTFNEANYDDVTIKLYWGYFVIVVVVVLVVVMALLIVKNHIIFSCGQ